MAFDGIVVANLAFELSACLKGGKIAKIAQPEPDELLLTIKNNRAVYRLLISANASLPLVYLTKQNKQAPLTAPGFCMLLRKHIGNGRILSVEQPGLERILNFTIEHLDEMGDIRQKRLIVELMGKHSNIIFCHEDGTILDSIKHIPANVSSVREVLPGRSYFIPDTRQKADPLSLTEKSFAEHVAGQPMPLKKAIYNALTGISPAVSEELCFLAALDSSRPADTLSEPENRQLFEALTKLTDRIRKQDFAPIIYYENEVPAEFSSLPLTHLSSLTAQAYASVSALLENYYAAKDRITRIRQKSFDLRRIVQTALERNQKKYDLQLRQLNDTQKREKFRICGELLNTYGYELTGGEKSLTALNYYTGEEVTIPLDETLDARENARRYFEKYNKLKRTWEALSGLIELTRAETEHLETIRTSLYLALCEEDLAEIKEELQEYGYIRRRGQKDKKSRITSHPLRYRSRSGFLIYVGKNNYQNEELTFKVASGNDWWFHAKGIPGSHVVVKTEGKELPDADFEEAARLAAYYSKGRDSEKVEIDYIQKKQVKKAAGGKPGFVIYHTNYSMLVAPDIRGIREDS
ncbi:MAG: fibronectin/fibrinogen-binding protein [Lachnospiraceae bacterium]|nr:fibronectin/fibrinogen-binding protein [Lachnospiraceae bacterium]